jgi:hypothetical protein
VRSVVCYVYENVFTFIESNSSELKHSFFSELLGKVK